MRVTRIRAADFRNLPFADVDTDAPRVFLLGENGQGKTNLLEAAALVSASELPAAAACSTPSASRSPRAWMRAICAWKDPRRSDSWLA